jgi:hypothetical protein
MFGSPIQTETNAAQSEKKAKMDQQHNNKRSRDEEGGEVEQSGEGGASPFDFASSDNEFSDDSSTSKGAEPQQQQGGDAAGGAASKADASQSDFSDGGEGEETASDDASLAGQPQQKKRAKRGRADPSTWKRNQKKKPKKPVKDIGPCNCLLQCCALDKYSHRVRERIRAQVDALPDRSATQTFLAKHITVVKRKPKGPAMSIRKRKQREFESVFFLPAPKAGDPPLRVCKHTYKLVCGVQDSRLRALCAKIVNRVPVGEDRRGKHGQQRAFPEHLKQQVLAHIHSFPCEQSHYATSSANGRHDGMLPSL